MGVNWSNHRKVDTYAIAQDSNGTAYTQEYYILASNISGKATRGIASDTSVVTGWYVSEVSYEPMSALQYLARITFRPYLPVGRSYNELKAQYELEAGSASFRVTQEMLGVESVNNLRLIEVNNSDNPPVVVARSTVDRQAMVSELGSVGLPGYVPSMWVTRVIAGKSVKGRLIVSEWNAADVIPAACPFTKAIGNAFMDKELVQETMTVTVYLADSPETVGVWGGVNSASNFPVTPVSGNTVAGTWIASGQRYTRLRDDNGNVFYSYARTATRVPYGLLAKDGDRVYWSTAKAGGVWAVDWPTGVSW